MWSSINDELEDRRISTALTTLRDIRTMLLDVQAAGK
jgi:hypothetical protein